MIQDDKRQNWGKIAAFAVVAVLVLVGVAYGVTYIWDKRFGPSDASAADCRLAQQLFDRAQTPPKDDAAAETWEQEIRQVRYTQLVDQGISTEIGHYVRWQRAKATGQGHLPTAEEFDDMLDLAIGGCENSGVDLNIPALPR
ncbi:hypothetical protein [Catenuloplanes japonicus]|uniref:hypothetical protein n=1 Tax=Catenuloplanes japonicus TaxID=33876 RepID=UPI000B22A673|nr:hypothetical protein [Catenuloplanes japonicus]